MVFWVPVRNLLSDFTSHWPEGSPPFWNIPTQMCSVGLLCPLHMWLNSEAKTAPFWWQQHVLPSPLCEHLSDPFWEKKSTRDCLVKDGFISKWMSFYRMSLDHQLNPAETRQACFRIQACQPGFPLLPSWKFLCHLTTFAHTATPRHQYSGVVSSTVFSSLICYMIIFSLENSD